MTSPRPELLPDGALLVPAADTSLGMVRLEPGHPQHAGWLAQIQTAGGTETRPGGLLAVLGAAAGAVMLGSIGPWVDARIVTAGGLEGDGWITLVFGVVCAVMVASAYRARTRPSRVGILLCGGVAAATGIYDAQSILTTETGSGLLDLGLRPGWGLWLCVLGSVLMTLWALGALLSGRASTSGGSAPAYRREPELGL